KVVRQASGCYAAVCQPTPRREVRSSCRWGRGDIVPALHGSRRSVGGAAALIALVALVALQPVAAEDEGPAAGGVEGVGGAGRGAASRAPPHPRPGGLPAVVAAVGETRKGGFAAGGVRLRLSVRGANEQAIGGATLDLPQLLPRERRGIAAEGTIPLSGLP